MIKLHKLAAFCVIGLVSFTGQAIATKAAEVPVAGIGVTLNEFYQNTEYSDVSIIDILSSNMESELNNIGIATVNNYVNIRSEANMESEILGKLYNNSAATIQEKVGEWYKITSGSVTGYINEDYLTTGIRVKELAPVAGKRIAIVKANSLRVRNGASSDASVSTLVAASDQLKVINELEGWIKVSLSTGGEGYVSSDYIELKTIFDEAISIEEEREREREREQERERLAAEQEARRRENVSVTPRPTAPKQTTATTSNTINSSSVRKNIVDFALRYQGNPYVWGGTSLTRGADCSGFTQSVFRNFGISIPRDSRSQANGGRTISINTMQPGDLIFYARNGTINHVAIFIGNGKVIHASNARNGIRISNYNYRTPVKVVSYIR